MSTARPYQNSELSSTAQLTNSLHGAKKPNEASNEVQNGQGTAAVDRLDARTWINPNLPCKFNGEEYIGDDPVERIYPTTRGTMFMHFKEPDMWMELARNNMMEEILAKMHKTK